MSKTFGDKPLGWGWLVDKDSFSYLVVKNSNNTIMYHSPYRGVVEQTRTLGQEVPDERDYPHFFLPIGVV